MYVYKLAECVRIHKRGLIAEWTYTLYGDVVPTTNRHTTPRRQIGIAGDQWERLKKLVGERGRGEVIRALVAWYLREPGAKLPERPPRQD